MLYNNQSAYTTALIVPNKEKIIAKGIDLNTREGKLEALKAINHDLNQFKKGGTHEGMFPERWLPSSFAVLPEPFSEQNGMINSTMKMVRGKIEKAYSDRIDYLYTSEGKKFTNEKNIESI
jgi:long-chain acyl-CoA synthetase